MNDPGLSRARARRPTDYEPDFLKLKRRSKRARYDHYARYDSDALPQGVKSYAKPDRVSRYDTGEPHPLDGDGAILTSYVDP
eukprot:2960449-Pleurochrysis_carterae.AAC.1